MYFHLPRRYRRPLLLPAGLVALAGLLLLGCLALRPWQELAKTHGVIQLTVPIYEPHPTQPTIRFIVPEPNTLCKRRFRHDAFLNGNPSHDQPQYHRIIAAIRFITADKQHNGLVCVRLAPTAHYANMVALLDLMERMNLHQHWFDFTRKPTAFYVFSSRKGHSPNEEMVYPDLSYCVRYPSCYSSAPTLPALYRFNESVIEFLTFQWLAPLKQPEWRVPLALLALLFLLSVRRLLANTRVARML
jgi:hypothetical protein